MKNHHTSTQENQSLFEVSSLLPLRLQNCSQNPLCDFEFRAKLHASTKNPPTALAARITHVAQHVIIPPSSRPSTVGFLTMTRNHWSGIVTVFTLMSSISIVVKASLILVQILMGSRMAMHSLIHGPQTQRTGVKFVQFFLILLCSYRGLFHIGF